MPVQLGNVIAAAALHRPCPWQMLYPVRRGEGFNWYALLSDAPPTIVFLDGMSLVHCGLWSSFSSSAPTGIMSSDIFCVLFGGRAGSEKRFFLSRTLMSRLRADEGRTSTHDERPRTALDLVLLIRDSVPRKGTRHYCFTSSSTTETPTYFFCQVEFWNSCTSWTTH